MAPRACVWVVLVVGLAAAGCAGRLDETKTAVLDPGGESSKFYDLRGQASEQTLNVEVTAKDAEINAYIVLAGKLDAFEKAPGSKGRVENSADSKVNTKSAALTAVVPPKTDVRVVVELAGPKKTEMTIRMSNKK